MPTRQWMGFRLDENRATVPPGDPDERSPTARSAADGGEVQAQWYSQRDGTSLLSAQHRKLMDELNSPLEVQQRLMRHADEVMTKHYGKHGWAIKRRMRDVHTSVTDLAMGTAK